MKPALELRLVTGGDLTTVSTFSEEVVSLITRAQYARAAAAAHLRRGAARSSLTRFGPSARDGLRLARISPHRAA